MEDRILVQDPGKLVRMSCPQSPDGRNLVRVECKACGYTTATAIWCSDPECCDQDLARFIGALLPAEAVRGFPVFAVRYSDPGAMEGRDAQVTLLRAGDIVPVFTGPARGAVEAQARHDC